MLEGKDFLIDNIEITGFSVLKNKTEFSYMYEMTYMLDYSL